MNKPFALLSAVMLFLVIGCSSDKELEFENVRVSTSQTVCSMQNAPCCKMSLDVLAAKGDGKVERAINSRISERLFGVSDPSISKAAKEFATRYVSDYRKMLAPMYMEDCKDVSKRRWYEYNYNVKTEVKNGKGNVLNYIVENDYYEGGAHGFEQKIVMNFNSATGNLITLDSVFVKGFRQPLAELLLEELQRMEHVSNVKELREKGYLAATEMFVPDNFVIGNFYVTFIFNAYEIASYDKGRTEIELGYLRLKDVLAKEYD